MTRAKPAGKMKAKDKKAFNAKARSNGCVQKQGSHSALYLARIRFDSLEMHSGNSCDLKTALEDLMVLTAVKQKMQNQAGAGTFVERLQAAIASSAAEHERSLADLKLGFHVHQSAGRFIGSPLHTPSVRSLELFGRMRSVLEPFRQYAKNLGKQNNVYSRYSPVIWKMPGNDFNLQSLRHGELQGLIARLFCRRFVPYMRLRPRFALQTCKDGSSITWPDKTRAEIGIGICEAEISPPAWNVGSGSRWQCETRKSIGHVICEKESYCLLGILRAVSNGNGRQEQTSATPFTRKESFCLLGMLGTVSNGNGRQEQTSAKKTATEVGLAQVHFRGRSVKAIVITEKTDCEMGTHAEKRV